MNSESMAAYCSSSSYLLGEGVRVSLPNSRQRTESLTIHMVRGRGPKSRHQREEHKAAIDSAEVTRSRDSAEVTRSRRGKMANLSRVSKRTLDKEAAIERCSNRRLCHYAHDLFSLFDLSILPSSYLPLLVQYLPTFSELSL